MANGVSPWFTRNLRGQALTTPESGYQSKWDVGGGDLAFDPYKSPVYDMLSRQQGLNRGVAGRQLGMMRAGAGRGSSMTPYVQQRRAEEAAQRMAQQDHKRKMELMQHQANLQRQQQLRAQRDEQGRATQMAAAMGRLNPRSAAAAGPFAVQNLAGLIGAIGTDRAHEGLMQTGRLIAQMGGQAAAANAGMVQQPQASPRYMGMSGSPTSRLPAMQQAMGYKKGSVPGTVPKTGPYELHEGEVVISADQVDPPLMRYLQGDKLRKMIAGQMDGKGTGPGHKGPTPGVTSKKMIEDEFQDGTVGPVAPYSMAMEYPRYRTGMPAPAPMPEAPIDPQAVPVNPYAPPGFGGGMGTGGPAPMNPGMGTWNWIKNFYGFDMPEGAEEPDWSPREYGEALRGGIGELWGATGEPAGEFLGGVFGTEEKPTVEETEFALETGPAAGQQAYVDQADTPSDIEKALGRVARGDYGSRDNPLELGPGDLSDEELQDARRQTVEGIRERGEDLESFLNKQKAIRMRDYALRETWLDPQTRKALMDEAKFLEAGILAQQQARQKVGEERAQRRQQLKSLEMQLRSQERQSGLDTEARTQAQQASAAQKLQQTAIQAFTGAEGDEEAELRALNVLAAGILREARAYGDRDMTIEEARQEAAEMVGMGVDQGV